MSSAGRIELIPLMKLVYDIQALLESALAERLVGLSSTTQALMIIRKFSYLNLYPEAAICFSISKVSVP